MARPVKSRRISCVPVASYFKPVGIPLRELEEVVLGLDELEAIRLADLEGLYQVDAALKMGVLPCVPRAVKPRTRSTS